MVTEYWTNFYEPSAERRFELMENDWQALKNITKQHEKIMYSWADLEIKDIRMGSISQIEVGTSYHVEADVFMGDLLPDDINVEAYYGKLDSLNNYIESFTTVMNSNGAVGDKIYQFQADIRFEEVGHFGLNVRITPTHPNPRRRNTMGLTIWGEARP
jgi:starch phosphorylase